jgi:hypothetical protein
MIIRVGQYYIDQGAQRSFTSCPIALAIKDQCPQFDKVKVDHGWIDIQQEGRDYEYMMKTPERQFVMDFDMGKNPAPFEFELALSDITFLKD